MKRTPQTRERRNDQFPRRPKHANQVGLHSAETVPFLVNLGGWFYDRHNPRSARRSDLSSMCISPMFVGVTSRFQASMCSTAFVDVARG